MKTFLIILLWCAVVLVAIQFIPVDRTNPPVDQSKNFVTVMNTPQKIQNLLKTSCYDCHSNETRYPKYAYVAPISWSVKHHINEGREHGNLSIWGTYSKELQQNFLKKAREQLQDHSMPLPGYIAQHPEAKLSEAERKLLSNYFEEILKQIQ